jgi:hypothetical protein
MNAQAQHVDPRDAAFIIPKATAPWSEPLLAGLPHIWVGISIALGNLSSAAAPSSTPALSSGGSPFYTVSLASLAMFAATCLGVVFFAWRRSWPLWTASWYSYAAWMLVILAGLAAASLGDDLWAINIIFIFGAFGGLLVGYLLLFRSSRLHALLFALFLMPVTTLFFMESLSSGTEAFLSVYFGLLAGLTAIAAVRWWSWPAGVTVALGANLVAGATLTYVSLYLTEIPDFYGDSFADAMLTFGLYFALALLLYLGPLLFWRFWDAFSGRRRMQTGS